VLNFGFVSNVGGNDWVFYQLSETREAEKSVTPIIYHGERCGLDSSFVVFPTNATGHIAIVRREVYGGRTLTWIGLYRAAPPAYTALRPQSGSFFYGCGAWLSGSRLGGADIAALLRRAIGLMGESFDVEKRPEEWNIRKYADDWMAQCAARAQAISDAEKTLGAGEGVSSAPNLARCCIDISGESETHGLAYALDLAQTSAAFNAKYSFAYISDDRAVIQAFENLRRCDISNGRASFRRCRSPRPALSASPLRPPGEPRRQSRRCGISRPRPANRKRPPRDKTWRITRRPLTIPDSSSKSPIFAPQSATARLRFSARLSVSRRCCSPARST
jgi:hypothetical protein